MKSFEIRKTDPLKKVWNEEQHEFVTRDDIFLGIVVIKIVK